MSAAWDISDLQLQLQLTKVVYELFHVQTFHMHLFKNDYVPVPGTTLDDFEEADYDGYEAQFFDGSSFQDPTVTDHVAATLSDTPATFTGDAGSWEPQEIFGYYMTDEDDNYAWCERFGASRTIHPSESIVVNAEYRYATFPASS